MVWHTAVDIVLNGPRALRSVRQITANFNLIASLRRGVYKCELCALKKSIHELNVAQERPMEEYDVGEDLELLRYHSLQSMYLRMHAISDSGRDADKRSGLTAGGIDNRDGLLVCHSELVYGMRGGRSSGRRRWDVGRKGSRDVDCRYGSQATEVVEGSDVT